MDIPEIEFRTSNSTSDGAEILEIGSVYDRAKHLEVDPFTAHRVNFHHVIFITEGSGSHFIDFKQQPYQAGSVIYVSKNQIQAFDIGNRPKGFIVLFTQEFIEAVRTNIRLPTFLFEPYVLSERPVLILEQPAQSSIETLLIELMKLTESDDQTSLVFDLLFSTIMLKLYSNQSHPMFARLSKTQIAKFNNFKNLMEEMFVTTKDAAAYGEIMGLSYKSLNQLCKQAAGQTPKQLIDAHTILEAKRRLVIEKIQTTQLAYELGFDDAGNFVKYFKKHVLMTPSQFQASTLD